MKQSTNKLNEAVERMTTGYKINHAKDNAANYSISTNMSTKISAYDVAADNVAMGMDMLTTASESMTQMENLGKRLHALNTQARNGTYGKQSLNAIQAEANSIIDEIDRLYSTAKYNGISLFNQTEYDIPDNMPKADPVTGFIEDPYDYTEEQIAEMISISKVDSFESGKTYSISSAKELKRFADIVNDGNTGEGSTFVLTADIDLSEYSSGEGWTPIGNETNQFKGTFNGNGHIISNLTINRPTASYQGLFGYAHKGEIKNVGILNSSIIAKTSGLLLAVCNNMKVENTYSQGYLKGGADSTGGLISTASFNSQIKNCYSETYIENTGLAVGGLIGYSYSNNTIESCYTKSRINGNRLVGGIIGSSGGSIIKNSYSLSELSGNSAVGGLVGNTYARSKLHIDNCISYSRIKGERYTGSCIGQITQMESLSSNFLVFNDVKVYTQNLDKIGGTSYSDNSAFDYDLSTMSEMITEISLNELSTDLQVGTKSDSNSQIDFNTNFEYSLGRIVRNGIHTDEALKLITQYLNTMSDKQTQLGAAQNRLESAMDEILTQHDNLVSARSTLRDADMAELSSAYIQQQILQEASATLMSTANQSPAIALQLI